MEVIKEKNALANLKRFHVQIAALRGHSPGLLKLQVSTGLGYRFGDPGIFLGIIRPALAEYQRRFDSVAQLFAF
jgi:hypothetical protein